MSLSPSAKSRGAVVSYLRKSDHGKITEQAQNYLKKYACWPRNFVQIESKIEHVSPLTSMLCSRKTTFQTISRLHVNDTKKIIDIPVMFSFWVIAHVVTFVFFVSSAVFEPPRETLSTFFDRNQAEQPQKLPRG